MRERASKQERYIWRASEQESKTESERAKAPESQIARE